MKIRFLLLACLLGCNGAEESTAPSETHLDKVSQELTSQYTDLFRHSVKIKPITVTRRDEHTGFLTIERRKILVSTGDYLIDSHYPALKSIRDSFYHDYSVDTPNARTAEEAVGSMIESSTVFNDAQKDLMNSFVSRVSGLDDISQAGSIVSDFNQKVQLSALTEEEKIQLISFSALTESFVNFVKEDAANEVYTAMVAEIGSDQTANGRTAYTCSINWRGVWVGAVFGFFGGAASGAYAGATAGTFTVPLVGTVTGAVGGGMVGGAAGFVGGAAGSVVQEIFQNCLRGGKSQQSYCQEAFDRFNRGEINALQIPETCISEIVIKFQMKPI